MIRTRNEWGYKEFNIGLSIIGDEDCGDLLFMFFYEGFAHWYHSWEDCLDELVRESHNLHYPEKQRETLWNWAEDFKKTIAEMKDCEE